MSKSAWGEKRVCQSCKALFYDMQRCPIVCPKCNTEFNLEAGKKPRRSKHKAKEVQKIQDSEIISKNLKVPELLQVEDLEEIEEIELEDDDFIEDTVELEEDDHEVDGIIPLPKRLKDL
jgi:uncharacterized protein (TIGR02300 family)